MSKVGKLSSELLLRNEVYNTTEKVFNHLTEGDEIWAAVMPHDTDVYFVLDETGTLFPV